MTKKKDNDSLFDGMFGIEQPDLTSMFNQDFEEKAINEYKKIIGTKNENVSNRKDIKQKPSKKDYNLDDDLDAIKDIYMNSSEIFNTFKEDILGIEDKDIDNVKKTKLEELVIKDEDSKKGKKGINLSNIQKKKKELDDEKGLKTGKADDDTFKLDVKLYKKDKNNKLAGFNGIAGMEKLKQELEKDFIKPIKLQIEINRLKKKKRLTIKDKEILDLFKGYEDLKINIPTGFLMYGPPGTGKTFISKKLAEELEANFISQTMGDLGSSYQHQTTQNIKKLFQESKKISNERTTILFLDEIDSLVSARTDRVDANKAEEISQFLQEFNKLAEEAPNLIVIAATNRPDHLDSALLRSGRFDKKIYVGPPDEITREKMFRLFIEKEERPNDGKINFKKLSELTENYVSADLENIVREASRNVGENILDLISAKLEGKDKAEEKTKQKRTKKADNKTILTQKALEDAIKKIPSSISLTDMSVYDKWNDKMNSV